MITLSEMPARCPVAGDDFGSEVIVRQLFVADVATDTGSYSP
jgi:hypothetical protein